MSQEFRITGSRAVEIAASVEDGIAAGRLSPGTPLPPVRELAGRLGVNPNTVASAYRRLRERGVVETGGRRGTRIRPRPASSRRDAIGVAVPPGTTDLSTGNPSAALLPDLAPALAAAAHAHARRPARYGTPSVEPALADRARTQLTADGVPAEQLTVTSGSLDAVERILQVHLRPGDRIAVEDPGWGSLLDLLSALGLESVPVAVDDEGPLEAETERALDSGARALIVTCRAQNPTGAAVSAARAARLRAVLARHPETVLIEDDHGYGIVDVPLHPLAGATRRWALVRSVAKAYGPDLRLAVLAGDVGTVERVAGRHRLGTGWVSHLLQHAVVELWRTDGEPRSGAAAAYRERRGALLAALRERGVAARGVSGLNVWVPVGDETGVVSRLLAAGWAVAPGARFRITSPPGVRVTVADLDPRDAERLAEVLAEAVSARGADRWG